MNLDVFTTGGEGNILTVLRPFNEPSRRLQDDDLIEILDITAPPQKEFFNPFREPAPDLDDTKVDAGGKAHSFCFDGW